MDKLEEKITKTLFLYYPSVFLYYPLYSFFTCVSSVKAEGPQRGDSLLLITVSPEVCDTHLIDLVRMKVESTLEGPSAFDLRLLGMGILTTRPSFHST